MFEELIQEEERHAPFYRQKNPKPTGLALES